MGTRWSPAPLASPAMQQSAQLSTFWKIFVCGEVADLWEGPATLPLLLFRRSLLYVHSERGRKKTPHIFLNTA